MPAVCRRAPSLREKIKLAVYNHFVACFIVCFLLLNCTLLVLFSILVEKATHVFFFQSPLLAVISVRTFLTHAIFHTVPMSILWFFASFISFHINTCILSSQDISGPYDNVMIRYFYSVRGRWRLPMGNQWP